MYAFSFFLFSFTSNNIYNHKQGYKNSILSSKSIHVMKQTNKQANLIHLLLFASFFAMLFTLNGCKKTVLESQALNDEVNEKMIDLIRKNPKPVINVVNQQLQWEYEDENGNTIDRPIDNIRTLDTGPGCFDIDEDNFPTVIGENYDLTTTCITYKTIHANFIINSKNAIVLQAPWNSSLKTVGRLEIKNGATIVWRDLNIQNISIVDLGINPLDATQHTYRVSFEYQSIPRTDWDNYNYTKTIRLRVYTECIEDPINGALVSINLSQNGTTCTTVHPVYVGGSGIGIAGVAACTSCCYSYGSGLPNQHYIEFSTNSTFSTIAYSNLFNSTDAFNSGITLTASTQYYYRYKNSTTGCVVDPITFVGGGPWSPVYSIIW